MQVLNWFDAEAPHRYRKHTYHDIHTEGNDSQQHQCCEFISKKCECLAGWWCVMHQHLHRQRHLPDEPRWTLVHIPSLSSRKDTQSLSTKRPLSLAHLRPLLIVTACFITSHHRISFRWPHFCEECREKSQQQVNWLTHLLWWQTQAPTSQTKGFLHLQTTTLACNETQYHRLYNQHRVQVQMAACAAIVKAIYASCIRLARTPNVPLCKTNMTLCGCYAVTGLQASTWKLSQMVHALSRWMHGFHSANNLSERLSQRLQLHTASCHASSP